MMYLRSGTARSSHSATWRRQKRPSGCDRAGAPDVRLPPQVAVPQDVGEVAPVVFPQRLLRRPAAWSTTSDPHVSLPHASKVLRTSIGLQSLRWEGAAASDPSLSAQPCAQQRSATALRVSEHDTAKGGHRWRQHHLAPSALHQRVPLLPPLPLHARRRFRIVDGHPRPPVLRPAPAHFGAPQDHPTVASGTHHQRERPHADKA